MLFFGGRQKMKESIPTRLFKTEFILGFLSVSVILVSAVYDQENSTASIASCIGTISLLFNAKGNPVGQALMILFSFLYGMISYSYGYYGEMITYLGMSAPMALFSLIVWIKNPYRGQKKEVELRKILPKEIAFMFFSSLPVTLIFYPILKEMHTTNLIPSTLSVTTSYFAVYLTFKRSIWFPLGYALNDLVLIVLWGAAFIDSGQYFSVLACFCVFFVNDLYGLFSLGQIFRRQQTALRE